MIRLFRVWDCYRPRKRGDDEAEIGGISMTEMVYGAVPTHVGEPILPKWWRTVDKWTLSCILGLFIVGLLLGLAASVPLAARNGFDNFHYVQRQAVFGCTALVAMVMTSMMTPTLVRRLAVIGFACAFMALAMLPVFGLILAKALCVGTVLALPLCSHPSF